MAQLRELPLSVRALVAALLALTAIGLFAYWPSGAGDGLGDELRTTTVRAEVADVRDAPCAVPEIEGCQEVVARLAEGPDSGDTTTFDAGTAAGEPQFAAGDDIRLAATGPAAVGQGLPP